MIGTSPIAWKSFRLRKWNKKLPPLQKTYIGLMFLFPCGSISGCCGTHLIPSCKSWMHVCGRSLKIWTQIVCFLIFKNPSHRRHIHQVGEAFGKAILRASFANIVQNAENIQLCCETNLSLDRIVETMWKWCTYMQKGAVSVGRILLLLFFFRYNMRQSKCYC